MEKWAVSLFLLPLFLCGCSGHILNVSAVPKDAEVSLIPLNAAPAPYSYGKRYPEGEYTVRVSNPGYIRQDYKITLDKDTRLDAVLKRASHKFSVFVTPRDSSALLTPFGGGTAVEYAKGPIPEGEYLLTVSREGYESYESVLVLNSDIAEKITLRKSPGAIDFTTRENAVKEVKKEDGEKDPARLFTAEYARVGLSPLAKKYLAQAVKARDLKILSDILVEIKTDMDMRYAVTLLEGEGGNASETALAFIYLTGYLTPQDTAKANEYLENAVKEGGKAALCLKIYALLEEDNTQEAETLATSSSLTGALPTLKSMSAKDANAKDVIRYAAAF